MGIEGIRGLYPDRCVHQSRELGGGPLINIYGEVVGINTAIVASGQGIGFAIPINLAKLIADQLIANGKVERGWLGVRIQALTPDLADSFGLEKNRGVLVSGVFPGLSGRKGGAGEGRHSPFH